MKSWIRFNSREWTLIRTDEKCILGPTFRAVSDGEVTVFGTVESDSMRQLVIEHVKQVGGVKHVVDEIIVSEKAKPKKDEQPLDLMPANPVRNKTIVTDS